MMTTCKDTGEVVAKFTCISVHLEAHLYPAHLELSALSLQVAPVLLAEPECIRTVCCRVEQPRPLVR